MSRRALVEYVAPIGVFALLTAAEPYLPPSFYPVAYVVKACAVTAALLLCRSPLRDIRPTAEGFGASVLVGIAVFVAWVGIDKVVPYPHLGGRVGFNPYDLSLAGTIGFLAVRLYGLVLLVPVMEELFWRSFVLRYVTTPDFLSVPVGTFSLAALGVMVACSGIAHPEWLVAVIASLVYALWLRRTRSLFAAIVAHATTNAALGIYILVSRDWTYW